MRRRRMMMMDGDGDAQLRVATCVAQHQHRIMHATAPFQFIMQRQQLSLLIGAVQWRASGQRTAMMGVRAASDKKALELSVPPSLQPPILCFSFGVRVISPFSRAFLLPLVRCAQGLQYLLQAELSYCRYRCPCRATSFPPSSLVDSVQAMPCPVDAAGTAVVCFKELSTAVHL